MVVSPVQYPLRRRFTRHGAVIFARVAHQREVCDRARTGVGDRVSFERYAKNQEWLGGAVSAAASWAGRGSFPRRPSAAVPDDDSRRATLSTGRDGSVTTEAPGAMEAGGCATHVARPRCRCPTRRWRRGRGSPGTRAAAGPAVRTGEARAFRSRGRCPGRRAGGVHGGPHRPAHLRRPRPALRGVRLLDRRPQGGRRAAPADPRPRGGRRRARRRRRDRRARAARADPRRGEPGDGSHPHPAVAAAGDPHPARRRGDVHGGDGRGPGHDGRRDPSRPAPGPDHTAQTADGR